MLKLYFSDINEPHQQIWIPACQLYLWVRCLVSVLSTARLSITTYALYQVVWTLTSHYLPSLSYTISGIESCVDVIVKLLTVLVLFSLWDTHQRQCYTWCYVSQRQWVILTWSNVSFVLFWNIRSFSLREMQMIISPAAYLCVCFCANWLWKSCLWEDGAHTAYETLSLVGLSFCYSSSSSFNESSHQWIIHERGGLVCVLVSICFADTCWCIHNKSN